MVCVHTTWENLTYNLRFSIIGISLNHRSSSMKFKVLVQYKCGGRICPLIQQRVNNLHEAEPNEGWATWIDEYGFLDHMVKDLCNTIA